MTATPVASATIPRLNASASVEDVVASVGEAGCCIVEHLIDDQTVENINSELAPHIAATPTSKFEGPASPGTKTRRTGAIIALSPTAREVIAHPLVTGVARKLLLPCSRTIQLAVTQHICVEPGEKLQMLHRDECAWELPDALTTTDIEVSTLWALDEFTPANGATQVAPGSHLQEGAPESFALRTVDAVMPPGSIAIYTGKTVHGAGANTSSAPRRALHVTYCADWLRQKENQFLSTPIEVARLLKPELLELIGFKVGAAALGYTRNFEDPLVAIYPERYMPLGLDDQS